MTGVILAMSRLKDFVNGFMNLKSIRSIDTKDSMKTHQPTQLSKNMKTKVVNSKKKFLPVTHKQDSYVEFHTLKQQTLTVEEFIAEFERVCMRCGVEENEEQTIARFLGSLRTDIS
ncbi:reverse transcriptase domain-containing protein, partial [Tanacetum coccineum]